MIGRITVERVTDAPPGVSERAAPNLARDVWVFWYDDRRHALVVDEFQRQTRPSRRHGWTTVEYYNRVDRRRGRNIPRLAQAPPIPPEITAEAKAKFCEPLRVGPEEEFKRG